MNNFHAMKTNLKKFGAYLSALLVLSLLAAGTNLFLGAASAEENSTEAANEVATETKDIALPSDVENLKATSGDAAVLLEWSASTDDTGVTGYKIYRGTQPVLAEGEQYNLPMIPVGAVTRYTVKNLTNGQKYYFSATAVDAAGNESGSWAYEVSAKPESGKVLAAAEDDGKSPQVKETKAEDVITVLVIFSESVKLPEEHPASAFTIAKNPEKTRLEVQKAEIDTRDPTGATVILTTAPQEEKAEYLVTAGIELQDLFGTPVISGTTDTGSFKGSAKKKQEPEKREAANDTASGTDTEAPKAVDGKADFNNAMAINFSEKMKLPKNPLESFKVVKKGTQEELKIKNVTLSIDGKTVFLSTGPQKATEYEVRISDITDEAGNEIAADAAALVVTGKGASLEDLIPPEDVTKLVARIKDAEKNLVELQWQASKNTAGDLDDQTLYQSAGRNGKTFKDGQSLGADATGVEVEDLTPGSWYTFKVTTKDESGNESKGAITSVFLPETGPGAVAALLTGLVGAWWRRRKKTL